MGAFRKLTFAIVLLTLATLCVGKAKAFSPLEMTFQTRHTPSKITRVEEESSKNKAEETEEKKAETPTAKPVKWEWPPTNTANFQKFEKLPAPSPDPTPTPEASPAPKKNADELANQIQNPAAPVTLLQFRDVMIPNIPGTDDITNELQIQFVKPILPSKRIPFLQLMRFTLPVASLPGPIGKRGLGDLEFFDLFSLKTKWGNWGFGPTLVFPTATERALGAGKWQAGPAFAIIVTKIKNWTFGSIFQNPISFAGDSKRPSVNNLIISPTVTYNIPKEFVPGYWKTGWFIGLADFSTTINWKDGVTATVPLGLQLGRVFHIGDQPFSASIEAGGTVKRPPNTPPPGLILGFEFGIIFK